MNIGLLVWIEMKLQEVKFKERFSHHCDTSNQVQFLVSLAAFAVGILTKFCSDLRIKHCYN